MKNQLSKTSLRMLYNFFYNQAIRQNKIKSCKSCNSNKKKSCCDLSQINLNTAETLVLSCVDLRTQDNIPCHLNKLGYKNNYDHVITAGVSLGYNGFTNYTNGSKLVDDTITVAYNLHKINKIFIIEHENCGAYSAYYGDISIEDERKYQLENVEECGNILWEKFK